jgi:hypothetical protein
MNITINILEVASELAHKRVVSILKNDDDLIYEEPSAKITGYTDEAQDLFNEYYDEYFDFLLDLKEE